MIAEVYPVVKLPRRFTFFDYHIPDSMAVGVGDLVSILFHGREVFGVVKAIKLASEERKLAPLRSVVSREWSTGKDVERWDQIARAIAQSPSSLLHSFITSPTLYYPLLSSKTLSPAHTVKKSDVEKVSAILQSSLKEQAVMGDSELGIVLLHALIKSTSGQILVLVPTEREAELVGTGMVLHGHTPPKARGGILNSWRKGELRVLVGTRTASLLPAKNISAIIVLDAGNEEHKSTRRNPRFDAREAAKLLAEQHKARIFFLDPLPFQNPLLSFKTLYNPSLLSLKNPLERTDIELVSATLLQGIEDTLRNRKNVLLFLNRKGVAKRLQCGACGHLPLCGSCGNVPTVRLEDLICERCGTEMWIPKVCPSCGKPKISLRGIGGTKVVEGLQKYFPQATVARIEKGSVGDKTANILVATEYFFSAIQKPFVRGNFGLVADLAADIGLHGDDFRSAENTARKMHRLIGFAERENAECILQTWLPDVLSPMLDAKTFTESELQIRKTYNLPPFTSRYILEGAKTEDLPTELQTIARQHGEAIELRFPTLYYPLLSSLSLLPDSIKITPDTSYALNDRPPQPK